MTRPGEAAPSRLAEASVDVGGEPDAVPRARRLLADTLRDAGLGVLVDDASLVLAELLTNALLHAGPPVRVRVRAEGDTARVEVEDGNPTHPFRGLGVVDGMTGRGLHLVAALAARYGSDPTESGKVVWAELVAGHDAGGDPLVPWPDSDVAADPALYEIALGDVPTNLLLHAKTHVDNIVREFALAAAGAATGQSADVPAHLATLIETVTTRFAAARQAIKRQAVAAAAAGQTRTTLVLRLPLSAADAGLDYLRALDEADDYARAVRLLTLATPPQHRAFRRWYVGALVSRLRAVAAGLDPGPVVSFEEFLLDELAAVSAARQSADRGARLQAVTAALARATDAEAVAHVVVTEGVDALGAAGGGLLVRIDPDHLALPGAVGYSETLVAMLRSEHPEAELPAAHALRTGEDVWIESTAERDATFPALGSLEPDTVALCAMPLETSEAVIGALRFSFAQPRIFDDEERAFVGALAAQTAIALERAQLIARERAARERFAFLSETTDLLGSSLEPEATLRHLTTALVPRFADWAAVYQRDADGRVARPVAIAHGDPELGEWLRESFHDAVLDADAPGGVTEVLRTGRTVRYSPVPAELARRVVRTVDDPAMRAVLAPTSAMAVALRVGEDVIGVVGLVRTGDREAFSEEEQRLVEDVASRAAIAVYNAQSFGRQREVAVTLQRSLLPQRLPRVEGVELAWRYSPADAGVHVGGDWYDVIPVGEGRTALVIGDVMGRGLEAAAVMGQIRAAATALIASSTDPAWVLRGLDAVAGRLEQDRLTTALIAVLDTVAGTVTVASAGHLPPLVVPVAGEPSYVAVSPGPPLGAGPADYVSASVPLPPGSTVLLFTDGLVESRDRPVDEGLALLRAVAASAGGAPQELCDAALRELAAESVHDDVAILAARVQA